MIQFLGCHISLVGYYDRDNTNHILYESTISAIIMSAFHHALPNLRKFNVTFNFSDVNDDESEDDYDSSDDGFYHYGGFGYDSPS